MAYTGAITPNTGTDTTNDLARDVELGVLESFVRGQVVTPILWTQTITRGTAGRFVVEGKEDDGTFDATNVATYAVGTQVDVSDSTQDERTIALDRPQYEARRIDRWDEAVASYPVMQMNVRQVGNKLSATVERKALAAIEAASLATGLVNNGDGYVALNADIASGTTLSEIGDALCETIYEAAARIKESDTTGEVYFVTTPRNYAAIVNSQKAINTDFVSQANGGFDLGEVRMVGGVIIQQTNDLPATAGLEGLMYTTESAGIVKLWDVQTKIGEQQEFLDAKLITAYYANGMGAVRPNTSVSVKSS